VGPRVVQQVCPLEWLALQQQVYHWEQERCQLGLWVLELALAWLVLQPVRLAVQPVW
jgi:hypothetical protein